MDGRWKILCVLSLALVSFVPALTVAARAVPKAAVFDFELVDTSLEGATKGPRADEAARLKLVSQRLRDLLATSGQVDVVDVAPAAAAARASDLRECGDCAAHFARDLGARYAVSGWVQKVSNLILNMNVEVRDARTADVVWLKSADMRGNTDESWSRAIDYLVKNYLLAPGRDVFR